MLRIACFCLCVIAPVLVADEPKPTKPAKPEKPKTVAGRSELLRDIPKKYATLIAADDATRRVELQMEGETEVGTWDLSPEAEIKVHGWWGRLKDLPRARVWVWFDIDRKKQPRRVLMICDELSQQDINGFPSTLEAADELGQSVTIKPFKGAARKLGLAPTHFLTVKEGVVSIASRRDQSEGPFTPTKLGDKVFVQSKQDRLMAMVDAKGLDAMREEQKKLLRQHWEKEGLPGTVTFLHRLGGEMELTLDHEAMRWGRSLKTGDIVTIAVADPIKVQVKFVEPWRERTLLRLVTSGFDQADLTLGQRVRMKMAAPAAEVDTSIYPPDIDRPRTKAERIEWFLASIYCSCKVGGDRCTGMFYTLASCNENACGMPNAVRAEVAELIDKRLTDRQIFDLLLKDQGPIMLKPHLLP